MKTEIIGIVEILKKDKKGLKLDNNEWYSNQFLKEPLKCKKGDKIKVFLNEKGFLTRIEMMEEAEVPSFKSANNWKQDIFPESMKISYCKDLFVVMLEKSEKGADVTELAKLSVKVFKIIQEGLNEKEEIKTSEEEEEGDESEY